MKEKWYYKLGFLWVVIINTILWCVIFFVIHWVFRG